MNVDLSQLQYTLNGSGFEAGRVDGLIGPKTIAATTRFQAAYAGGTKGTRKLLDIDGIPGPLTREAAGDLPWLAPHFKAREFSCRHCRLTIVRRELVRGLEVLRQHLDGAALIVVSGYRCPAHNAAVGGASRSQHLWGTAADLAYPCATARVYEVEQFSGVGEKRGRVRHVDVRHALSSSNTTPRATPSRPVVWQY